MRLSLKAKLIILMVLILGATVLVSYIILDRSEAELLQQVVQHVKSVEQVGSIIEIQHLFAADFNRLFEHQVFVRLSQRGEVAQVSFLNTDREVLASSMTEDVGLSLQELKEKRVKGGGASLWERLLNKHITKYDVTFPLMENGEEQGYLHIIFVMNDLEYLIKKAKYSNMLWIVGIFISGTIIATILVKRFTRPIDELVRASKAVAAGNFDVNVPRYGRNELDTLIAGFNEMTRNLKAHQALEERFRRSERMAALGELGARLAHEIRNPLNSISLIIDHIKDRFAPGDTGKAEIFDRYVGNIKTELQRLNKLVTDFLQVSRPLRPDLHPLSVKTLFLEIGQLLESEAEKYQVNLDVEVSPDNLEILGDENLIKTAWMNIALNAIQAMEQGGRLRITAYVAPDNTTCEVVFSDTGPGIPKEDQEKIFEPYFTTKDEGTGLGLAIVNRVIADHQGTIEVESDVGNGATIALTLPMPKSEELGVGS